MAPVLRNPTRKKLGRPKKRKTRTCFRCKTTFSSPTKLKNHLTLKRGSGPKAVALQQAKRKEASRFSTKVHSIKRELDKVGLWEDATSEAEDDSRARKWVSLTDNTAIAKELARLDWTQVMDLR